MIIAHRAGKPENTLEAFKRSILNDIPAIEFDVHLTLDRQLVVTHDDEIEGKRIADLSLHDINIMYPTIPTLYDVLECVSRTCHCKPPLLNIEVKPWDAIQELAVFLGMYLNSQTTIRLSDLVFTSFLHTEIIKIRKFFPKARIGFIYRCWPANIVRDLVDNNVDLVVLSEHAVKADAIASVRSQRIVNVWVYTINDFDKACTLVKDCQVDGIITDIPHDFKNKIVNLM